MKNPNSSAHVYKNNTNNKHTSTTVKHLKTNEKIKKKPKLELCRVSGAPRCQDDNNNNNKKTIFFSLFLLYIFVVY